MTEAASAYTVDDACDDLLAGAVALHAEVVEYRVWLWGELGRWWVWRLMRPFVVERCVPRDGFPAP